MKYMCLRKIEKLLEIGDQLAFKLAETIEESGLLGASDTVLGADAALIILDDGE